MPLRLDSTKNGIVVLCACSKEGVAYEDADGGMMTGALLALLTEGSPTFEELAAGLNQRLAPSGQKVSLRLENIRPNTSVLELMEGSIDRALVVAPQYKGSEILPGALKDRRRVRDWLKSFPQLKYHAPKPEECTSGYILDKVFSGSTQHSLLIYFAGHGVQTLGDRSEPDRVATSLKASDGLILDDDLWKAVRCEAGYVFVILDMCHALGAAGDEDLLHMPHRGAAGGRLLNDLNTARAQLRRHDVVQKEQDRALVQIQRELDEVRRLVPPPAATAPAPAPAPAAAGPEPAALRLRPAPFRLRPVPAGIPVQAAVGVPLVGTTTVPAGVDSDGSHLGPYAPPEDQIIRARGLTDGRCWTFVMDMVFGSMAPMFTLGTFLPICFLMMVPVLAGVLGFLLSAPEGHLFMTVVIPLAVEFLSMDFIADQLNLGVLPLETKTHMLVFGALTAVLSTLFGLVMMARQRKLDMKVFALIPRHGMRVLAAYMGLNEILLSVMLGQGHYQNHFYKAVFETGRGGNFTIFHVPFTTNGTHKACVIPVHNGTLMTHPANNFTVFFADGAATCKPEAFSALVRNVTRGEITERLVVFQIGDTVFDVRGMANDSRLFPTPSEWKEGGSQNNFVYTTPHEGWPEESHDPLSYCMALVSVVIECALGLYRLAARALFAFA
jgi:hypothetical protein